MRSLIILEVHHGEDTDDLTLLVESLGRNEHMFDDVTVLNSVVRVDVPPCFVLDS